MVENGEASVPADDLGLYRRAEIAEFVTWARATVIRLRDHAERSLARAASAERRLAEATERAERAEARAAVAESARAEAERALQHRDRDLQAVLGKALLAAQRAADEAEVRASQLLSESRADAQRARDEAQAAREELEAAIRPAIAEVGPPEEPVERAMSIWPSDDEDDSVFAPLRSLRARGA